MRVLHHVLIYIKPPGSEPVPKKRTRMSKSSAQQPLCWLHKLDGFSMNTHAGRMGGEYLKHLHLQMILRIVAPAKKAITAKIFKWFKQKVYKTFSNTPSNVRAVASHSRSASLRIVVRTKRILPTIGSESCCVLWLQDTIDDGRRILCARVQHGEPLAISAPLRNGSSASLCNCNSMRFLNNCHARLTRRKVVNNFPNNIQKQSTNLCAQHHSSLQQRSSTTTSEQVSAGGANLTICERHLQQTWQKEWKTTPHLRSCLWSQNEPVRNRWRSQVRTRVVSCGLRPLTRPPTLCKNMHNVFGTDEHNITTLQTTKLRAPTMFASLFVTKLKLVARLLRRPSSSRLFQGSVQGVRTPFPNHTISAKCPLSIVFHIRKASVGSAMSWRGLASRPRQRSFTTLPVASAKTDRHVRKNICQNKWQQTQGKKKKTTCSISNVTLTKTTSGEKPKNVAESTPIKDKTSVNGKQLTVGNMAQTWPKQACVPPKRPEQTSTLSLQREWKKGATTKKNKTQKPYWRSRKTNEKKDKDKDKENNFEVGKYRETSQKGRENIKLKWENRERDCLCHAQMCDITRQMRETSSRQRQNTDRKRRHAPVPLRTHLNSASWMVVRKTKKNERACPSRPPNNSWVATQTRLLLNEHTCGSHGWRISQTFALANMLPIVSSPKSKDNGDSTIISTNCTPIGFR